MKMLAFVESQMNSVAPNVSAIVGTTIAAKLIGAAGGLDKLAELPSTVVQILGSKKKTLGGMSTTSQVMHAGVMKDADIIQNTPPAFRSKILRLVRGRANYEPAACTAPPHSLHADQSTPSSYGRIFLIWQVAGKVTLAARVDAFQDRGDGAVGQRFRDEIEVRHVAPPSTWQSPPILHVATAFDEAPTCQHHLFPRGRCARRSCRSRRRPRTCDHCPSRRSPRASVGAAGDSER